MVLPIKQTKKLKAEHKLPIQIYLPVFRWEQIKMLNLETQTEELGEMWRWVGQCNLNSTYNNGRKFRDIHGRVSPDPSRRVYGAKAIAEGLTDARGIPISEAEVKAMLNNAIATGILHAKICLESDLYPTSPEIYAEMGLKNRYLILADVPSLDEQNQKLNKQLKEAGSPLRVQSAIKVKLVEA